MNCTLVSVTKKFYVIRSRSLLDEAEPPSANFTDEEFAFVDPDFASCIDYNRHLNNSNSGKFLNCSMGQTKSVAGRVGLMFYSTSSHIYSDSSHLQLELIQENLRFLINL